MNFQPPLKAPNRPVEPEFASETLVRLSASPDTAAAARDFAAKVFDQANGDPKTIKAECDNAAKRLKQAAKILARAEKYLRGVPATSSFPTRKLATFIRLSLRPNCDQYGCQKTQPNFRDPLPRERERFVTGMEHRELLEVSILFLVGEGERRFSALCRLRDIGRYLVQATPLSITEIGGGVDVLLKHQLQGKPIEGLFIDFNDARDGIRAWAWKFVEDNASKYR